MMGGGGFGNMMGGLSVSDLLLLFIAVLLVGAGIIYLILRSTRQERGVKVDTSVSKAEQKEAKELESQLAALKKELAEKKEKDDHWSDF